MILRYRQLPIDRSFWSQAALRIAKKSESMFRIAGAQESAICEEFSILQQMHVRPLYNYLTNVDLGD